MVKMVYWRVQASAVELVETPVILGKSHTGACSGGVRGVCLTVGLSIERPRPAGNARYCSTVASKGAYQTFPILALLYK